ncbi:MAG: cobalamin B12-binding domain-containing protein [Deltaproteobacteria bacterium]|nr:cobalamin B12-binding domain-containing protein [Deltaproteobacteria bacterium]
MAAESTRKPDRPWLMRTYSGHTSARASNALYRKNLAKGQTGLSVAFDLPTQTGYDSDHPLARGEVGKVGVPICHIEDVEALLEGIPLEKMNTSMTINATAAWLLALYVALAERRGIDRRLLEGTTQNDIIKEYLSRGTHIFPPRPSLRLIGDVVSYTVREIPRWNPINVCSYHLQEAGATPVQEIAFALANAICVLDTVRASGAVAAADFAAVVGRISFFVNAGVRFVEEMCKMRAFADLWDEICRERYGVADERLRRFRYGVQVNSLGLTEAQPENNVQRIVLEMLAVVLSKRARARSVQLPAWNEALGLPRPWDQQWSLRIQQVIAYESDLLEHDDLFDGAPAVERTVAELKEGARAELDKIGAMGGALTAVENAYLKQQLVASNARRLRRIESGEQVVVGVNQFTETEPSPLAAGGVDRILTVDPAAEREQIERLRAFRSRRGDAEVKSALRRLREAATAGQNVLPPSIACAHVGVTTGEWADVLRAVFGEFRAPTGVGAAVAVSGGEARIAATREKLAETERALGRKLRLLVGKPGLDGHSNGAEQIALMARDVGFEVLYEGIRSTPEQIARTAADEDVSVVGLSILSGSHLELVPETLRLLRERRGGDVPVVVGGIIPGEDRERLLAAGVRRVYTPKDFDLAAILDEIVDVVRESNGLG